MKASDLRVKTEDELKDQLTQLRKEAFNLRFQAASGQLANTSRVRAVRRETARIRTLMAEQKAGFVPPKASAAKVKTKEACSCESRSKDKNPV
jgi:large subunit ribosomal protein L29